MIIYIYIIHISSALCRAFASIAAVDVACTYLLLDHSAAVDESAYHLPLAETLIQKT